MYNVLIEGVAIGTDRIVKLIKRGFSLDDTLHRAKEESADGLLIRINLDLFSNL